MKSAADSAVSLVLVLMAASSLFSMIGLFQLDKIVHQDLYNYGLQFSYQWATPYWNILSAVFAMGWLNIIAAIVFQSYLVIQRRREAKKLKTRAEKETLEKEAKPAEKVEEPKEQESKPAETVEEREKEQEAEPPREPEAEQKETKIEAPERSEETPIVIGVPEEEFQPTISD